MACPSHNSSPPATPAPGRVAQSLRITTMAPPAGAAHGLPVTQQPPGNANPR